MHRRWFRRLAAVCSITTSLTFLASNVQAGPIIDWFKNKHAPKCGPGGCAAPNVAYYPWMSYYPYNPTAPVTANYATGYPVTTTGYAPTVANYGSVAPVTYPAPVGNGYVANYPYAASGYVANAGAAFAQPTVTQYSPQPIGSFVPNVTSAYGQPAITGYSPVAGYAPIAVQRPVVAYRPVPGYRPTTVFQNPAVVQPTVPYYGAPAAACPSCQRPTVVNFAPNTNYRSAWTPVQVTYFRPVTGVDPTTGQPVTIVQPCTATTWQIQRYPTVVQYPFTYGTTAVAAPYAGTCGHVGCGPMGCGVPVTSAPYYSGPTVPNGTVLGPTTGTPITSGPITGAPTYGGSTVIGPTAPPPTGYPGTQTMPGRTPADMQPNLNPNGIQYGPAAPANSGGTFNYPPSTSNNAVPNSAPLGYGSSLQNGANYGGTTVPGSTVENGSTPYNGSTSSQYRGSTTIVPNNGNSYPSTPVVPVTPPNSNSSPSMSPSSSSTEKPELQFRSVPDPDALHNKLEESGVPQLVNPRDRSAAIPERRPLVIAPAKWPEFNAVRKPESSLSKTNAPSLSIPAESATGASQPAVNFPTIKRPSDEGWQPISR